MENVKQMLKWGPLVAKRDPATGRVVTLDKVKCPNSGKMINRVADKGERVPVQNQYLVPDKKREGQTWRKFVATFEALGYRWDYCVRCAADAGGHTTRTRLFFIARRDGRRFSKSTQVRMVGNSVDPVDAADFLEANAPWLSVRRAA